MKEDNNEVILTEEESMSEDERLESEWEDLMFESEFLFQIEEEYGKDTTIAEARKMLASKVKDFMQKNNYEYDEPYYGM